MSTTICRNNNQSKFKADFIGLFNLLTLNYLFTLARYIEIAMKKILSFFSLIILATAGGIAPVALAAEIGFAASTSVAPVSPGMGEPTTIHVSVKNLEDPVNDAIVDVEIYKDGVKTFQQFFEHQHFGALESKFYTVNWTPTAPGNYRIKVGVFSSGWSSLYFWKDHGSFFSINDDGGGVSMPSSQVEILWPTGTATGSGTQTFKALVEGMPLGDYQMFWRVDGGQHNPMHDDLVGTPNKAADVEFSGWTWRGNGPYTLTFEAKDLSNRVITFRMANIMVSN